jgi:predicted P-loop ATPase
MNARTNIVYGATPADWDTLTLLAGLTADLLPVVSNPHATISPDSKMKDLGKTPSRYNGSGHVAGIASWTQYQASDSDIARWAKQPDYGICIQTRDVRALDVDVPDRALATAIYEFIYRHLDPSHASVNPPLPMRERANSGKFLLAFRLDGERRKRRMKVEGGIIEFLGDGQQFIAVGTHPSGARYEWAGGLPDDFPVLTIEQFDALWSALAERFAIGLAIDKLGAMLEHLDPNSGYDDWLKAGMALHHETSGDETGLALWDDWSSKGAEYPGHDALAEKWDSFGRHTGNQVTAGWLQLTARAAGWTEDVSDDFDVVEVKAGSGAKTEPPPLPSFVRNDNGQILMTMDNLVKAIGRSDMVGMRIAYDNFRDEIMYSEDDGENWLSFKDADYTRLRIALERCGFQPPKKENTRDAVLLVAEQNAFDSAQLWLGKLEWDGVPRIERFMSTYFSAEDTPYTRAVGRYIWTALAGRVIEPGCKADMAPILVGAQGLRKSSGVAAIAPAPEFFTEISFGEKEDDLSRKMRGRLVAELAELKGLASRDSESIKAWMTKRYEDWTPKYREFNTVFPRRLLCFGTTNKQEFLVDETGHRRYLPVRVGRVDVEAIGRDCAQLWAEARDTFDLVGVDYHEAETLAIAEHGDYVMSDEWEPVIRSWLKREDDMTEQKPADRKFLQIHEVAEGALRLDAKNCKRVEEMRIGTVLRALGYTRKQMRVDGARQWVYAKDED